MSARIFFAILASLVLPVIAKAQSPADYNHKVLATVDWLAANRSGLGYDLGARYSSEIQYGDRVFKPTRNGQTMCVAAVFEVILRTLAEAKDDAGRSVSTELLPASRLDGSKAMNLLPYIFQYKSLKPFHEYNRRFSAGPGDAFVLFGIGQFVKFADSKPGDFIYFNRAGKGGGHATVFMGFLDAHGKITNQSASAAGFRYFSAQQVGTNGLGYRDAFFGKCPKVDTQYRKDCMVLKDDRRGILSVARLHHPNEWFTMFSEIRVARFFSGETIDAIYSSESDFRAKARSDMAWAEQKAKEAQVKGVFPWIATETGAASDNALKEVEGIDFDEGDFGPDFTETESGG